jgi:hypothetical protein
VHGWAIQPGEFWKMRPKHFWYLLEVERPQEAKTQRGKLSSAEVARLKRLIEE